MRWSAVIAICLLASGCATTPPTGTRWWLMHACTSVATYNVRFNAADGTHIATVPRRSCEAGNSAVRKIQAESGFYVSQVVIADPMEPNAFATRDKNGNPIVVITLGMMSALGSDEDAWAGLVGHEIAHLVKRHGDSRADAQSTARGAGNVLANVVSLAVPGVGGFVGGTVAGTAAQMAVYGSYTRPQEAEADELGLQWMVAAGYDPRGLLRLFEVLGRRASVPAFLSTHPATQDRASAVELFIAKQPTPTRSSSSTVTPARTTVPGNVIAAVDCKDATSEIRLKTLCLTTDGCRYQVEAIKKYCGNATKERCAAAYEQLPTFCERGSKAYSDRSCETAANRVAVSCAD